MMNKLLRTSLTEGEKDNRCRKWLWRQMLFLLVLFTTISSIDLKAQAIVIDGSTIDWNFANFSLNPVRVYKPDAHGNGVVDDQFTTGSKDFFFASALQWEIGQTKGKNDIANAAAVISNGILYFAGDRSTNEGDAQIGFWLYLNGTGPRTLYTSPKVGGDFFPEHRIGDLFILSDFTGGGRTGTVSVYRWVGTGGNVVGSNGTLNTTNIVGTVAENNKEIDGDISTVPTGWFLKDKNGNATPEYEQNQFFEGQVILDGPEFDLDDVDLCQASILIETRSSQSITASLDDFVGGSFNITPTVTVNSQTVCANLLPVTVTASPGDGTPNQFDYVWTVPVGYVGNPGNVSSFQTSVAGTYTVVISRKGLACPSAPASGTVVINPVTTATDFDNVVRCVGGASVTFTTTAGGSGPFTYQWSKDGAPIAGATNASYTINGPITAAQAGTYSVTVTGACGTASQNATLTVNPATTATDFDNAVRCVGGASVTFTTTPGGTGPFTYQWSKDGAPIAGATNASYTINGPITAAQAGTYSVTVTGACGTASQDATLTVNPVTTATDFDNAVRCVGGASVTFTTTAGGTGPFTYQWSKDGAPIAGATNASYTVSGPITAAQAGTYSVTVTGTCGTASQDATLTVNPVTTATDFDNAVRCVGGASVTFTTTPGGTGPFTYQWSKDGAPIAGATNASYTVAGPITAAQAGTYSVTITGTCGTASQDATLTVNPVTTATDFDNAVRCVGGASVTFTTTPGGTGPFTYQWSKGGVPIAGATNASYTVAGPITAAQAGTYSVTVSGTCGTASQDATLTVNPVTTATDFDNASRCLGGASVTFTTTPGGTGPFTYQWSKDGAPIAGATNASYTIAGPITMAQAGTYSVTVSGTCGTASQDATLTVTPVTTATDFDNAVRCVGGASVTFTTTPGGSGPFTYQWSKDGSPIAGATNASYTIAGPITAAQAGTYSVTVSGVCGTASQDATLTVNPVTTATDFDNAVRCVGGASVTFTTTAGGTGPFTYQWSKGGAPIAGATNASYTIAGPITAAQAGTYSVTVTGNCGTASQDATLTVNPATTATDFDNASRCVGGASVTFTTTPGGTGPFTYQWSKDGAPIAGATNASYTIAGPITAGQAGTYSVTVSGTCGTASQDATLTVTPVTTATDFDNAVRCVGGASVTFTTTPGGTGPFTYQWSKGGVPIAGATNASYTVAGPITAAQAGTYSVTVTGTCGTASQDATLTVNPVTTATDFDDAARCVGGASVTFTTTPGGTGPFTYQWSKGGAPIAGATNASYTIAGPITAAQAGTYSVTITGTCGTATQSATLTVNPLPIISCSAMPTLIDITSAAHNTQMNVDLSANADTDPTHYTYTWTEDGTGSFNFSDIKNPVYTAGILDAGQTISFTVTVTNKSTGCVSVSNCSVQVNLAGSCPEVPTSEVCNGSTNTYTAGRAATVNETWKWSVNNGATIVGADNGQSVTVTAGAQNFTLTLTVTYANKDLGPTVCTYEVTVVPCGGYCTYTQGKYGNKSPACDGDGIGDGVAITYPTVIDMIKAMLGVGGAVNPMYIGGDGITKPRVTIPATASAAVLLNASMPGGGTPRELIGNCTVDNVPSLASCWKASNDPLTSYLTKQGRINNVFLSQTITLGLNMRVSGTLSGFVLEAGTFATAKAVGGCGSTTPQQRRCYYNELGQLVVENEYVYRTIGQSIIDALDCKGYAHTVGGLYQLANDALANADGIIGTECGAKLSDISGAAAAINEGFDECRILIGWNVGPCEIPSGRINFSNPSGVINSADLTQAVKNIRVSAYPNPFADKVNFTVVSPVSGKASLEVYNMFGQKLQTIFEGYLTAGRTQVIEFRPGSTAAAGTLIYKLNVAGQQVTGKLINLKQ